MTAMCVVLGASQARAQMPAQVFSNEGLRYTVLQDHEVSVTYNDEDTVFLRGRLVIPAEITNPFDQQSYRVVAIQDTAFKRCDLVETIVIPAGLKSVGSHIVDHCFHFTAFEAPDDAENYTVIDGVLFNADATVLVCCPAGKSGVYTMPATVREIAPTAFSTCKNFQKITIAEGVKDIPAYTFHECWGLSQIVFPESLETIGDYAFDGTILQFLYFGKNLKNIGSHAFERSSLVECMISAATPPTLGEDAFGYEMKYTRLYVPAGAKAKYRASRWSVFPTVYEGMKSRRWAGSYR